MPYLIQILKGREKKISELLARHGLTTTRASLSEYLLTDDPKCFEVRRRDTVSGYILTISEISEEVARELLTLADHTLGESARPSPQRLVRILSGEWEGRVGMVSRVGEEMVTVHTETFGRLRSVTVPIDDVELYRAPEIIR